MHKDVHGHAFNERAPPNKPTSEAIGVEYLFRQTNQVLDASDNAIENGIDEEDEGFEEDVPEDAPLSFPTDSFEFEETEPSTEEVDVDPTSTDRKGIPGWDKVDPLAQALLKATGLSVSDSEAAKIINLYRELEDYDKKPLQFSSVTKDAVPGSFCQKKRGGYFDVVKMDRAFLGAKSRIMKPSKSRLTEALCIHLCQRIQAPVQKYNEKVFKSRWALVVQEYMKVRARILNSAMLLEGTGLQLMVINETTLKVWYKGRERVDIETMLLQGQETPITMRIAQVPLPPPRLRPTKLQGDAPSMEVYEPEDRSGKAVIRKRRASVLTGRKAPPTLLPKPPPNLILGNPPYIAPQFLSPPLLPTSTFFTGHFPISSSSVTLTSPPPPTTPISTHFRHIKSGKPVKERKAYCCSKCGRPAKDGNHRQVRGAKHCPFESGALSFEEFKAKINDEHKEKKKFKENQ